MSATALKWSRRRLPTAAFCTACEWHTDRDAVKWAKRHATDNPGHRVITERMELGEYQATRVESENDR